MFFNTRKEARAYAKSQSADTRRAHKAIACNQWRFDRVTGEYTIAPCYTVVLS